MECKACATPEPGRPVEDYGVLRMEVGPISLSISYGPNMAYTEDCFVKCMDRGRDFIELLKEQRTPPPPRRYEEG